MKSLRNPFTVHIRTSAGASRLYMILAVLAIVIVAGAVWFFFMRTPAPPPLAAPSVEIPAFKQARPDSAREVISALKENTPVDYASAYEKGEEFRADGELADAQLLYFFAARGGNGPAALALAGLYDPVNFDYNSSLMDEPDIFQAFKWYQSAQQAGEEEAAARLAALRTWSEQAAADGDPKAQQLLLQWEQ